MKGGHSTQRWKKGKLQDLVFFQRGFDITQAEQTDGPVPVISSSGVTSYHNESRAAGPGVVIGRKGTLGSVHYSEVDYWPHDTTLWSKDLRGNDPRFVYFFLLRTGTRRLRLAISMRCARPTTTGITSYSRISSMASRRPVHATSRRQSGRCSRATTTADFQEPSRESCCSARSWGCRLIPRRPDH